MNDNNTNQKLEQALSLLKLGWSVIPVGANKKPMIDWKPFQSIIATEDQIKEWFKNPKTNIGVVTGRISNLIVVDIDPRHGGTEEAFIDIQTVKSATGGGGWHYFFEYSEGLQNSANIKPGVDVRGEGGYVVVPPSDHQSGKNYEWVKSPKDIEIAPLPDFVKEWISGTNKNNGYTASKSKVNELLNGVEEGRRNDSAASVIGKLLKRYPKNEWDTEVWQMALLWNQKNNPPLSEQELQSVFDSIVNREEDKNVDEAKQVDKTELIAKPLTYEEVENKVIDFLPNSETALKLILAIAVSGAFKNPVMLWLLLVGVPSSGKTDLVRLIKDADTAYYLDNLTQNAFISGERSTKSNKVHDLLPLLDKKCLIIKDWTSIFSLDEKMTKKLLGDLVGIYDKEFTKFSSRRGNVSYSSAFSQLGCITPATLNKHTNYMNMVGPRFLCYSMPQTTNEAEDKSYKIIFSNMDRSLVEKEARLYVSSYLNQLTDKAFEIDLYGEEIQYYLKVAARLVSNCRGIVITQSASFKNEEGEEVKYYEVLDVQVEEPWRAVQQLISLAKYLSFVAGKREVGKDELKIIKEVVISSMPADRSQALRMLKEHTGTITAKELADSSGRSAKTSRRLLEELTALKVVEKIAGSGSIAADYKISGQFMDFLLLNPAEFMSSYSGETETPHSIENKTLDQLQPEEQSKLIESIFGSDSSKDNYAGNK